MQFTFADPSLHWHDLWFLLQGAGHTLWVTLVAGLFGTLAGIVLGWMRFGSVWLRWLTAPYVDVVRSVPMIIQLILANSFLALSGLGVNAFWLSVVVLSSSMAVVTSEVVRGGLAAVPPLTGAPHARWASAGYRSSFTSARPWPCAPASAPGSGCCWGWPRTARWSVWWATWST